ncbi:anaphase-promoting complex subunit 11-like, partial [Helianthus annuus]|uniref:anaphase-promoting complex subunit 11-like n=1 Tax=Helianthus annuus TaxID=4232 RepID=UPI001652F209
LPLFALFLNQLPTNFGWTHKTEWHAVASWTWGVDDETCAICKRAFDGCCDACKLPGDDCPPIWGACNHAFHLHCILKWVHSQTPQAHCPLCRREWQFKE